MHTGENSVAAFTPVHGAGGAGGFQRMSPTGGAAYGIPLYTRTPVILPSAPETSPLSRRTGSAKIASVENAASVKRTRFIVRSIASHSWDGGTEVSVPGFP